MMNRPVLYGTGLAAVMAAAVLFSAPHRPFAAPLPWDRRNAPPFTISVFPSGAAYAGERVSIAVAMDSDPGGGKIQVRLDSPNGEPLADSVFSYNGTAGKWQARLLWVWDSSGSAGWHTIYVVLSPDPADPGGAGAVLLRQPVRILPADERPAQRKNAAWEDARSGCCNYYYLAGTEAERDLADLIAQTEKTFSDLSARMTTAGDLQADGETIPQLALVFLPRMYGQGGLVIQEGFFTYADRNYTGTDFSVLLRHEMVHLLSYALSGGGPRATVFLQEGLAVFLTGGHYRSGESLPERAAALIALGDYTPLAGLMDSFYCAQHEAAYIEAGAFLEYLVGRFGWERVLAMFFDPPRAETPAAAVDAMLREHFGIALDECEAEWLSTLRSMAPGPQTVRDVEFTMKLFDLIRRDQHMYASGTSVSDLWIPDPARARVENITADYLPSPEAADAIALELMFLAAREAAGRGEWVFAQTILAEIERVLDAKQRRVPEPIHTSPTATEYYGLTKAVLDAGWEPLSLDFLAGGASVEARNPATLEKEVQRWVFVRGSWARGG